jgi:hypothetical protein
MSPNSSSEDSFAPFDGPLIERQAQNASPWSAGHYVPDVDLFRDLLTIPISQGESQESGRPAKAFDAWIAHELRRAGFPPDAVWPRLRRPRVLAGGLERLEASIDQLGQQLAATEEASNSRLKPPGLRRAIRDVEKAMPSTHAAYILGDFYAKQIDVGMSSWQRGPDLLISTKTMFSAYRKNLKNRHEEAVGEVSSLRRRHPMAAMGYAYLVRQNVFNEEGAYAILYDILTRLRRPGETFDATMLLVADWDDLAQPTTVTSINEPAADLTASTFFTDLIDAVTSRSPITEHQPVRLRRHGEPVGGLPDDDAFDLADENDL